MLGISLDKAGATVQVLDLGAGSGVWRIVRWRQSAPDVTVTAVDWVDVLPATLGWGRGQFGFTDRYTFIEGDQKTADFGRGHHVATLGHILHSEGGARKQKLLRRIIKPRWLRAGRFAITEFLVNGKTGRGR